MAKTCEIRVMNFAKLLKRFRIEKAHGFRLADFDPADTAASMSASPPPRT
jgi:hypothetical protein